MSSKTKSTKNSKSKTTHVVPSKKGGWNVKKGGSERSSGHFTTKDKAIDKARSVSRNRDSELYIHNKDGKIGKKDSHGGDSYPPEG